MIEALKTVIDLFKTKPFKIAFTAFVLSTLIFGVLWALLHLQFADGGINQIPNTEEAALTRYVLAATFPVCLIVVWFIFYVTTNNDASDVYTEVRNLLEGDWIVEYEANHGPISNITIVDQRIVSCEISINPENLKLEMRFNITNNPIFSDKSGQIINDVAIRYDTSGEYIMFYYFKADRKILPHLAQHIVPEAEHHDPADLEVEIFGRVSFKKPAGRNTITDMQGEWFDLNGNTSRLLALIDHHMMAALQKQPFSPLKLSEVPIHHRYFDARMGAVHFHRS
ncbi:hypothetical protein MKI84_11355 [Ancylobacter sp. A5.8]|uniref:hypothetical protein n=1 Tax=Ancylobacter gelatini TaxID=2919920 RepID=UPI001F4D44B7|nr:hypothetical protein [Ancylobacter gelatini]MCJ8143511.1 hypothetical protein [Ancylobacter gelatini]